MIYEDLLFIWLSFLLIELSPTLKIEASPLVLALLFLAKDFLFFSFLLWTRKLLTPKVMAPRTFLVLCHLMMLSFFSADLIFFGFKQVFQDRYFGYLPLFLLFFHYYLPAKICLHGLNFQYVKLFLALTFPFLILYIIYESFDYFAIDFPFKTPFLILMILFLAPILMIRILPVYRLRGGYLRDLLEDFSAKLGVPFRDIYLLKTIGPKIYTAGVLGFVPPFRYLFFSEPLWQNLELDEVFGVIAHEVAHLKNHHGFWLLVVLLSLSIFLLNALFVFFLPFTLIFTDVDPFLEFFKSHDLLFEIALGVYFVGLAFLFFRFIFAYFLRSFEREADLYASLILGTVEPLIRALYKVGELTGQLYEHSWHHYGLFERISYLTNLTDIRLVAKKHRSRTRKLILLWLGINLLVGTLFHLLGAPFWEKMLNFLLS